MDVNAESPEDKITLTLVIRCVSELLDFVVILPLQKSAFIVSRYLEPML